MFKKPAPKGHSRSGVKLRRTGLHHANSPAAVSLNATPRKAAKSAKVELRACNTTSCPVALRAPRGGPPGSLLPGMGRDRMREASPRRSCGADRRGRATKQTAPRRRNPKGRSSLTGRIERLSGLAKLDLRNGQFVLLQALSPSGALSGRGRRLDVDAFDLGVFRADLRFDPLDGGSDVGGGQVLP